MFTDIVSSTALLDAIGDDAWVSLIKWHDDLLRSLFAAYSGREIDHAGDGFFVVFPDAIAGLDCAVAIQRALLEHRRRSGFAPRLRIGLHVAEVIIRGGQVHGRGVHVAARIVDGTGADEILVSADSLPEAGSRYVRMEPRQMHADGLNEPIAVIPVEWRSVASRS